MKNKFINLIKLYNLYLELLKKLYVLTLDIKKYLVDVNIVKVQEITIEKERTIKAIIQVEKEKSSLVIDIMGEKSENINLSEELINHMPRQYINKLQDINLQVNNLVLELKQVNIINDRLIRKALQVVEYNMRIITHASINTNYSPIKKNNVINKIQILDTTV